MATTEQRTEQRKAIGRRLASAIVDKGMTREEFAKEIGVSLESVNSWCNGRNGLTLDKALCICDALNWPLDRLAVRGDYVA